MLVYNRISLCFVSPNGLTLYLEFISEQRNFLTNIDPLPRQRVFLPMNPFIYIHGNLYSITYHESRNTDQIRRFTYRSNGEPHNETSTRKLLNYCETKCQVPYSSSVYLESNEDFLRISSLVHDTDIQQQRSLKRIHRTISFDTNI